MAKVTLISLKWLETVEGNKLISFKPVEVAEAGAKKLLQGQSPVYPTWIEQKDAHKFELEVTVEDVQTPKATKTQTAKPVTTAKKPRVQSKESLEAEKGAEEIVEGAEEIVQD